MSFVMCKRNELLVSEILNKNPHAFVLRFFIAVRAWRGPGVSPRDCDIGEALIGDYSKMGMTEQKYRTAKKHLEKMGFITTKSTNKGTVAKLINTKLFDPNFELGNEQINGQITSKQRAVNEQVTTNNNCKNLNNWNKREAPPTQHKNLFIESGPEQMEVVEYGSGLSIPEWYCKHYHDQKEIKRSWQNTQGNLINWKLEISKWFENDGKPTRESEHGKINRGNSRKSNANTGTLNEGKGNLYASAARV